MNRRTLLVLCLTAGISSIASAGSYSIVQSSGGSINGGGTDIGNHCDDCNTSVTLPFTFTLYGTAYTTAIVSSNGNISFGFGDTNTSGNIPNSSFGDTIFPYWKDQCTSSASTCFTELNGTGPFGIFASTTGPLGSQVYSLEWVTYDFDDMSLVEPVYELHLYQGQTTFDVVYASPTFATNATIGVQHDLVDFTIFQNGSGCEVDCGTVARGNQLAPTNTTLTFSTGQAQTPEPATFALIGLGLIAIPAARKFRKK